MIFEFSFRIPTVFVFLTNEWMTQVVVKFPAKTEAILDDIVTYTKLIPTQIDFVSDQYGVVDKNIRVLVEGEEMSYLGGCHVSRVQYRGCLSGGR